MTGHNANGRSVVLSDGPAPNAWASPDVPGLTAVVPWQTAAGPVSNEPSDDPAPADREIGFPEAGGTVLRVATFPPDSVYSDEAIAKLFATIGSETAQAAADAQARHFWFHRTDSLDYAVVLDGEIWLLTDEDERRLGPGDVVIQRGTSHAWSNRSGSICRMAFVLIGADPLSGVVQ
ncbi:cupin domain-containing protein [Cryptosporangium phraense]|uniref:cupin domain-containing protein n=1 Tax=Cryptosporangium phraense TaxID=2593070 RepID=UPI00197AAED0|nr:cupin domain-containing protein [Cryptosporangium phraense]